MSNKRGNVTQHENIYCRNKVDAYMYLITTNKKESDNSSCVHIFFFPIFVQVIIVLQCTLCFLHMV